LVFVDCKCDKFTYDFIFLIVRHALLSFVYSFFLELIDLAWSSWSAPACAASELYFVHSPAPLRCGLNSSSLVLFLLLLVDDLIEAALVDRLVLQDAAVLDFLRVVYFWKLLFSASSSPSHF
jgi:hypothetical protein